MAVNGQWGVGEEIGGRKSVVSGGESGSCSCSCSKEEGEGWGGW